ncbi:hemin uptake protein HemP [Ramlibacter sp. 2FC]|uniref:hemin uptake protein HemP n=1 Tax=Ramlibacter sp. 2FC TaxID=2502188 RepID=UPI0010F45B1E|nr:hemin uptake protein HemP [Ramlibacter sp. 2FC]
MHNLSNKASLFGADGRPQASNAPTAPDGAARTVHSQELLQGRKAVEISHNGAIYRLQATRLGKLILTK